MSDIVSLGTDALFLGFAGWVYSKNHDAIQGWVYKKLHRSEPKGISERGMAATMRAHDAEILDIEHEKKKLDIKTEIVIAEARLEMIRRKTDAFIQWETQKLTALSGSVDVADDTVAPFAGKLIDDTSALDTELLTTTAPLRKSARR